MGAGLLDRNVMMEHTEDAKTAFQIMVPILDVSGQALHPNLVGSGTFQGRNFKVGITENVGIVIHIDPLVISSKATTYYVDAQMIGNLILEAHGGVLDVMEKEIKNIEIQHGN